MPPRCCRYCQQSFHPSPYRPQQSVCGQPDCQRRRRADYHRQKIASDLAYRQIVDDSRKKWRDAHPDYSKQYRQQHPLAAERNLQMQRRRDQKRRIQNLLRNRGIALIDSSKCEHSPLQVDRKSGREPLSEQGEHTKNDRLEGDASLAATADGGPGRANE